jgi:hypothetical protein
MRRQVGNRDRERHEQHEPARRRRHAELVVLEDLAIEIDRKHLGQARRPALRQEPDFRESADRENVAEQHRDEDRGHDEPQRDEPELLPIGGAVDPRRFEHVLRDGGERGVKDEERERQVVPHGDGTREEQRRDRIRAPRKLRQPESTDELRHHADVGLEHVAPHDDAAAFGNRVGREDHGNDHRFPAQWPRQQHREPEAERHLDINDRVDEEKRVPERAPEDLVAEELRVVRQSTNVVSRPYVEVVKLNHPTYTAGMTRNARSSPSVGDTIA